MTQFEPQRHDLPREQRSSGGGLLKYLLIGCLGMLVVGVLLIVIGAWVIYKNARGWAASASRAVAVQVIEEANLPEDQKQRVMLQIDRVADAFKDKRITLEQLGQVFEKISQTPVVNLGMVHMFESKHIAPSGLSEQEKADARRVLERVARGLHEKVISEATFEELVGPLMEGSSNGRKLRDKLSDADLRDLISRAKPIVEQAGVPDEAFEVDIAGEIEQAVNEVIGQAADPAQLPSP